MNIPIAVLLIIIILTISALIIIYLKLKKQKKDEAIGYTVLFMGANLITASSPGLIDAITVIIGMLIEYEQTPQLGGSINWAYFILGTILLLLGIYLVVHVKKKTYILNINAYVKRNIEEHSKALNMDDFSFKEREIDIISIYKLFKEKYAQNTIKYIEEEITTKAHSFLSETKEIRRGYTGIAPIPLIMFLGSCIGREHIDDYYEYNKNDNTYSKLSKKNTAYPQLLVETNISSLNHSVVELVVVISITQKIEERDLAQFNHLEKVHISLPEPGDNIIQNKKQLKDYCDMIMNTIENIGKEFANLNTIHLLCSAQSCLPLEIGKRSIDSTRLPVLISYQYEFQSNIKYPWGIIVNGDNKGKMVKP